MKLSFYDEGLFYGTNLIENFGESKVVKYGVTADYILNLEVVLTNGDIIWTNVYTLKNSVDYNLR